MATAMLRKAVSKKKKRYKEDGFDLDLTYITNQIIAMGFPSEGVESGYRNPMPEVQRFFSEKHAGHYRIYNLCSERDYEHTKFESVCRFPFNDHNPAPLPMVGDFCENAAEFLQKDEKNVISVHCKAGKGRTGLMICALLMHMKYPGCETSDGAFAFYGEARTKNKKGVTIASQQRYVRYYEQILNGTMPMPVDQKLIILKTVRMFTIPKFDVGGGCDPYYRIFCNDKLITKSKPVLKPTANADGYLDFDMNMPVMGDVKVEFIDWDRGSKDDKMFAFTVNTNFQDKDVLELRQDEIDGANKDMKKRQHFKKEFKVQVFWDLNPEGISEKEIEAKQQAMKDEGVNQEDWDENDAEEEDDE